MRGQISDQDLTDYALNELQPEERFYVESMLAVSEECRGDVYEMIELSQLLQEGFEVQEEQSATSFSLTAEQREKLLDVRVTPPWLPIVGGLAAAACAAFALTNPDLWKPEGSAAQVAQRVSTALSEAVSTTVASVNTAPEVEDVDTQIGTFRKLAEDPALRKWFTTDWLAPEFSAPEGPWTPTPAVWDPMPQARLEVP